MTRTALFLLALLVLLPATAASAASRVALVIGNSAYRHVPVLANPRNDAAGIGSALDRLGFSVTRLDDADYTALRRGLQEFQKVAATAEIAIVFYAGHGIEVDQRNFLVPIDARLASDRDVEFETVPLGLVIRSVEHAGRLALVILDACRDNPFAARMQRSGATRSIGRGLAQVEPSGEMLVAYAAKGGTTAADGTGRNSPYSAALLRYLEEPGLEVGLMFRKVREAVLRATGNQEPFTYGSLSSEGIYFSEPPPATSPSGDDQAAADLAALKRLQAEEELLFWESIKDSDDPEDFRAYRERYPGGRYDVLALNRLRRLEAALQQSPAAVPVLASPTPEEVEITLGLEPPDRRRIQTGLASLGFDPGPADGHFGPGTRGAIRRLQSSRRGEVTGFLDAELSRELLSAEAAAPKRLEPGTVFRDCEECPELVVVPAGSFEMGSPPGEEGRVDPEGPVHTVAIPNAFAVGKFEVTRGQYARFVSETGHSSGRMCWTSVGHEWEGRNWRNPGFAQANNHPAVCVSWQDAQSYVAWLSEETGERYRLLTESEWEYVARSGTTSSRYWGNTPSSACRYENVYDRTGEAELSFGWAHHDCHDGYLHTSPAGAFGLNGFGLYDVLGNVREWVADCWNERYAGAPADGSARTSGDCSFRVKRGGSWKEGPQFVRSAYRFGNGAEFRCSDCGFRVARNLD